MKRIMPILQHKVSRYSIKMFNPHFCCYPHRASEVISGEILEYGVAVQVTHYCHAHWVCGGWEGIYIAIISCCVYSKSNAIDLM